MFFSNFVLFLCFTHFYVCTAVIVTTKNGKINGGTFKDKDGAECFSFQGVPYGKPPVGNLRFKAPVPVEPWEGVLDATKEASICVQYEFDKIVGQEDCLHLNVYTPKIDPVKKMSVMVYIHGGAYFEGSGNSDIYGPQFLMPEEVVLVTINYRLGRFGSLSFEDQTSGVPGNAHLKDQVLALKWVQENIAHFGGDKDSITIFGSSVGGASSHMHMLSPMSKGLFHRAISQSGIALNAWNEGTLGTGKIVAEQLGLGSMSDQEIIEQLQKLPMEKIMETQSKDGLGVPVHTKFEYSPVIEKQTNEPAFLTDLPIKIIESGNYTKVPYMFGYNSNDTIIFQVINRLYFGTPYYITNFSLVVPHDINIPNEEERKHIEAVIKERFYGQSDDFSDVKKFCELSLGPWITAALKRSLIRHLRTTDVPIYFYVFSGDTKLNFFKKLHPITANYKGASHMDELGHLFKTKYSPCIDPGSPEDKAMNNIVKLWTNFAKYGNPTPENNTLGVSWSPVTKEQFNYLDIGVELKEGINPNEKIFSFWQSFYQKYNHD